MSDDRSLIDPQDRYPACGFSEVERHALFVLKLFPQADMERTRDAIQFEIDEDRGVVLIVTPEALELRLPTTEWTGGAYGPAASSRLWKRTRWVRIGERRLRTLVESAIAARQEEFVECRFCHRQIPFEHRHDDTCHGCAERHLGIVH